MNIFTTTILVLGCVLEGVQGEACFSPRIINGQVAASRTVERSVSRDPEALDVVISAESALVWDVDSGEVLYEKNAQARRPVASLSKLLSVLVIREYRSLDEEVTIPQAVRFAQVRGAHVRLPVGDHATVQDLLAAGLIASANDAMVALAVDTFGSEEAFVEKANEFAQEKGLSNTRLSNATGLSGGLQYSTAENVRRLLSLVYRDPVLKQFLNQQDGFLATREGFQTRYETTNDLLGTYFPVLAAKTGYTVEAGENLVVITEGEDGQQVGAVVLGSQNRFVDMKVLVEWIWRNYSWQ